MSSERSHGGEGSIHFARILTGQTVDGPLNFIDHAVLPPGSSIGRHTHSRDEEEFYLILRGSGQMTRNNESFRVSAGDLIRNPPGGTHELVNDANHDLAIFVFELAVSPR